MPRNLILAYAAAWIIHGTYLAFLFAKNGKLKASRRAQEQRPKK